MAYDYKTIFRLIIKFGVHVVMTYTITEIRLYINVMIRQNDTFRLTDSYLSNITVVKMSRDSFVNTSFAQCLLIYNNISQQNYTCCLFSKSLFFYSYALALYKNSDVLIVRSCKHYKKRMDFEALVKLLPKVHIRVAN